MRGRRPVVQLDRRKGMVSTRPGVTEKFGVPPESIPDYLGARRRHAPTASPACPAGAPSRPPPCSPATATSRTSRPRPPTGTSTCAAAAKLAATLRDQFDLALLFRRIATVEPDAPTIADVDELRWTGPTPGVRRRCASGSMRPASCERAVKLADAPGLTGSRAGSAGLSKGQRRGSA